MARTPYPIELSEVEERELRRRARQQTRAYREVLRAKIVLLAAEGLENAEIARGLDTTREAGFRPWHSRSGIFPRAPDSRVKAARVLDLYAGRFEGKLLPPGEFVLCADEKPSIQARAGLHATGAPVPAGDGQLVEHEYERM